MKTIYITYNSGSDIEQSTALRLQTISNLYGLNVELPARVLNKNSTFSQETKRRIENSEFVVAFSLESLTDQMRKELDYAIKKNKVIIVIFDEFSGSNIKFGSYKKIKKFYIDYDKSDETLHNIAEFLTKNLPAKKEDNNSDSVGLGIGLVGIGLGLLAIWALTKE